MYNFNKVKYAYVYLHVGLCLALSHLVTAHKPYVMNQKDPHGDKDGVGWYLCVNHHDGYDALDDSITHGSGLKISFRHLGVCGWFRVLIHKFSGM